MTAIRFGKDLSWAFLIVWLGYFILFTWDRPWSCYKTDLSRSAYRKSPYSSTRGKLFEDIDQLLSVKSIG